MIRTPVPSYADRHPEVATTLEQARLPFYCCNCYRKRETIYLTPDFGPFCSECLKELWSYDVNALLDDVLREIGDHPDDGSGRQGALKHG